MRFLLISGSMWLDVFYVINGLAIDGVCGSITTGGTFQHTLARAALTYRLFWCGNIWCVAKTYLPSLFFDMGLDDASWSNQPHCSYICPGRLEDIFASLCHDASETSYPTIWTSFGGAIYLRTHLRCCCLFLTV